MVNSYVAGSDDEENMKNNEQQLFYKRSDKTKLTQNRSKLSFYIYTSTLSSSLNFTSIYGSGLLILNLEK